MEAVIIIKFKYRKQSFGAKLEFVVIGIEIKKLKYRKQTVVF